MIGRETLNRQLDIALKRTPAQVAAKRTVEGKAEANVAKLLDDRAKRMAAAAPPPPQPNIELIAQRERLVERFALMQSDLGGAFYEMAVRDHVRIDVLTAKAAELQRVDSELAQVDRRLELERTGAVGVCSQCETPYGPGAAFCSQCGSSLTATNGNV